MWASAPTEPPQLLRGWGIQHCVSVLPLASAGEHYGYGKAAGAEGQQQKHRHQREGIRGVRDGCRALGGSLCGRAGLLTAGVCGVPGTVLLSACAGSSVSGCTVSAAGAAYSAITATLPKLVQKLSAASSALKNAAPFPQSPVGCWYRFS